MSGLATTRHGCAQSSNRILDSLILATPRPHLTNHVRRLARTPEVDLGNWGSFFGIILVLLTAEDIRFTAKDSTLYVFVMGWPKKAVVVNALGIASPQAPGRVRNVALPGYKGELRWKPHESSLRVEMPAEKISDIGVTLKVALA